MNKALGISVALAFVSWGAVAPGFGQERPAPVFHSAELVSASNVRIPYNSVANGIVELHVTVGETGSVESVEVVRELASVTEESVRVVKGWSFAPATLDGKPVASRVTVSVVFCPWAYAQLSELPLPPIENGSRSEGADSNIVPVPVEITSARYPRDFNGRQTGGTVVVQLEIGSDGQQRRVKVVQPIAPLTDAVLQAIKEWKFKPARLSGEPVRSEVVLAFKYRGPVIYAPN